MILAQFEILIFFQIQILTKKFSQSAENSPTDSPTEINFVNESRPETDPETEKICKRDVVNESQPEADSHSDKVCKRDSVKEYCPEIYTDFNSETGSEIKN